MQLRHYITITILVAIDQITKHYAMSVKSSIVVNQFFNVVFVKNYGITFGLFNRADEFIVRALITMMTILITIYLCILAKRNASVYSWVIAGAVGNLADRVSLGYVVDFLDFHVGTRHWPAFNVADSCICLGVILILFDSFRSKRKNEVR